ncbi:peptidase [Grosmannia clavigera kw1407]|uniref:Peptidase n=1 Tax=Grosmannia clavigera (strain kw1407 / UAMH 11150) TaxID=655863 RepID=F0XKA8_GROCL|nr:peptidase [Grosmannia clavigera kw1407]EFX01917.1 peptidase [Grosmannia clavigera kw1407]
MRHVIEAIMGPGAAAIVTRPTVNVGPIRSGPEVNVISDACIFVLDMRLSAGLVRDWVLALIYALILQYDDAWVKLVVQEASSNSASYSTLDYPMAALLPDNSKLVAPGADKPLAVPSMRTVDYKHHRYTDISAYVYGCSPHTSKDDCSVIEQRRSQEG